LSRICRREVVAAREPPSFCSVIVPAGARGQDTNPAASLVARAADYVRDYEQRFTGIVAEEHQTQRVLRADGSTAKQRSLVSDVMLVRVDSYGPRVFRDVIAVDGKPVRSRDERLKRLFLGPSRKALDQLRAIRKENTRYDIGSRFLELAGALTMPLVIVKSGASVRFRFQPTAEGVAFSEVTSPTMWRSRRGFAGLHDMPITGRMRIDTATGALHSASLALANAENEGSVEVDYAEDEKIGLFVPIRMRETYRRPSSPRSDWLDVVSEYSNFRRFDVSVTEQIALPQ
jgi:hypothetical protein